MASITDLLSQQANLRDRPLDPEDPPAAARDATRTSTERALGQPVDSRPSATPVSAAEARRRDLAEVLNAIGNFPPFRLLLGTGEGAEGPASVAFGALPVVATGGGSGALRGVASAPGRATAVRQGQRLEQVESVLNRLLGGGGLGARSSPAAAIQGRFDDLALAATYPVTQTEIGSRVVEQAGRDLDRLGEYIGSFND